jgi:hypothetical protein
VVTTKTKRTIEVLRSLHGPGIPDYPGSPHEGEEVDDAELILHELGHIVQNPKRFSIEAANINGESIALSAYIERLSGWRSDLHEMRAVAIELVAARKLGLRLTGYRIIANSLRNTKLFYKYMASDYTKDQYSRYIARIKRLPSTQRFANLIVAHVNQERKILHEHPPIPRHPRRQPKTTGKTQ